MKNKFEKMSQEMDALCDQTKTVTTRAQARELSLKKWRSILEMSNIFFDEFNVRCGFCGFGEFKGRQLTKEKGLYRGRCRCCGVKTVCDEMVEKAHDLESETLELIDGLISHFEQIKVAEG